MDKNKKHNFFVEGPITPEMIASSISGHQRKTNIGAHQIFLGQVRADLKESKTIAAIEYSAYRPMADEVLEKIREEIIVEYELTCAHVKHSLGKINSGEICFWVFVSSPHRNAAFKACEATVNRIKSEAPIFGKELFDDLSHQWKVNS